MAISRYILLRMRNVLNKSFTENQNTLPEIHTPQKEERLGGMFLDV
jgi:hypothetical protein